MNRKDREEIRNMILTGGLPGWLFVGLAIVAVIMALVTRCSS